MKPIELGITINLRRVPIWARERVSAAVKRKQEAIWVATRIREGNGGGLVLGADGSSAIFKFIMMGKRSTEASSGASSK